MTNKIVVLSIVVLIIAIGTGFVLTNLQKQEADFLFPQPSEVVKQYFESWDKGDFPNMYSTISDGFKKIEPTAENLAAFKEYVISQNIADIDIISIKEASNNNETAVVDYSVEFVFHSGRETFEGSFTLKFRQGDIIRGWKLIHPYGDKIDTS